MEKRTRRMERHRSRRDENTRRGALFTSVTLVWNGCSRRNCSQGRGALLLSLSSLPPRKNEINAALWHRTKGKGLSVNLTTLRFRLQNSFRRMENERNDTKGPPTVRQDPVLGMRLIVTYFTSAQIASLGIVVRWIVMDPLD